MLRSASSFFPDKRRPYSRTRQSVIDENPALQERDSHKLTDLGARLADALRARGVDDLTADMAAHWIRESEQRSFFSVTVTVLGELAAMSAELNPR